MPASSEHGDVEFLSGKRVLVVEDEYVIASDVSRRLRAIGVDVAGPVATVDPAMALTDETLDAAVLDLNLRERMAYPVAHELERRHVPFVFTTGYEKSSVGGAYPSVRMLEKPVNFDELTTALVKAMRKAS